MRKVKSIAKNGQALNEVVTFDDLTVEERKALHVYGNIEDYATFQVRHNKKGDLLGVSGNEFAKDKISENQKNAERPNVLDLYTAFGDSNSKVSPRDRKISRDKFKTAGVYDKAKQYVVNQK